MPRKSCILSDPANGYYGGEGLEEDLRAAHREKRLFGILNGCEYPRRKRPRLPDWSAQLRHMREQVLLWAARSPMLASAHFLAQQRARAHR